MTEKERLLVLSDLSARQCYGVMLKRVGSYRYTAELHHIEPNSSLPIYIDRGEYMPAPYAVEDWKPLLRKISSMTESEKDELFREFNDKYAIISSYCIDCNNHWSIKSREEPIGFPSVQYDSMRDVIHWFYKNNFDINGLIEKGLAEEATEKNL